MIEIIQGYPQPLQSWIQRQRKVGRTVGFVPTMGFFHEGHLSLMRAAGQACDMVVVSNFVNPTQFSPNEDLEAYPRDPERDNALAQEAGAHLMWYPRVEDLYPPDAETRVTPGALAQRLCGLSRPNFFGGICTVVLKLLQLVKPDTAFFGEKDFQQLAIIRQMVKDFFLGLEVVGCPVVREADGLAMSSRNVRITPKDRVTALTLWHTLQQARSRFAAGETRPRVLAEELKSAWPQALDLDYLEFRDPVHLDLAEKLQPDTRLFLGAWLNGVRLIDNGAMRGDG